MGIDQGGDDVEAVHTGNGLDWLTAGRSAECKRAVVRCFVRPVACEARALHCMTGSKPCAVGHVRCGIGSRDCELDYFSCAVGQGRGEGSSFPGE